MQSRVLHHGRGGRRGQRCNIRSPSALIGFEGSGKGPYEGCRWLLEAGKSKERDAPESLQ